MAIAVAAITGWAWVASASEPPFTITTRAGTFEVQRDGRLPPRLLGADRTCRVGLSWSAGATQPRDLGCPAEVAPEVLSAVARWQVLAPPQAEGSHDLGELWFVYPLEQAGSPRILVRQAHDRDLSLPYDIDAVPFVIRVWSFVRWPEAVHHEDHPDVQCGVEVEANTGGIATSVSVTGCDLPFQESVRQSIGEWRFEPALVDGEPIPTALSMVVTFLAEAPPPPEAPSERSQQLWAQRQFGLLTREERMWFIRTALLGPDPRDLGPGRVLVSLPTPPVLGERPPPIWADEVVVVVPELPDHPPLLLLGEPDAPVIEVFTMELPLPERRLPPGRCGLVVQVDDRRRVGSWAQESCDPELRDFALQMADQWVLRLLPNDTGATRARFHARLETAEDGTLRVVLPAEDLRAQPERLPFGVHTERQARVVTRVPPRLPRGASLPQGSCELQVTVNTRGHPEEIEVRSCPEGMERAAQAAVRRWRWSPAEENGTPTASTVTVAIRFQP
jgi:TonB family protein